MDDEQARLWEQEVARSTVPPASLEAYLHGGEQRAVLRRKAFRLVLGEPGLHGAGQNGQHPHPHTDWHIIQTLLSLYFWLL